MEYTQYTQIIENLEQTVKKMENAEIFIGPLNKIIENLKSHSQNIKAVEQNIEAVRAEVINPIKKELNENKRAGKFSIWGLYVGIIALFVTTLSIGVTTCSKTNLFSGNKLTEIEIYYIAYCIKYQDLIVKNAMEDKALVVLMANLAEDFYSIKRAKKENRNPKTKIEKRCSCCNSDIESYLYHVLLNIDKNIIEDLSAFYAEKYLKNISRYIDDGYLFVNDENKEKFIKKYLDICKELNIIKAKASIEEVPEVYTEIPEEAIPMEECAEMPAE